MDFELKNIVNSLKLGPHNHKSHASVLVILYFQRFAAAANKLEGEGFQNVACTTSGLQSVTPGTFDSVGSTELQNAGKAGLVTIQGKISAVLGTVLVCAYRFITFFPDQAEK